AGIDDVTRWRFEDQRQSGQPIEQVRRELIAIGVDGSLQPVSDLDVLALQIAAQLVLMIAQHHINSGKPKRNSTVSLTLDPRSTISPTEMSTSRARSNSILVKSSSSSSKQP